MAGILAIWNDCASEGYDHFERWYIREHLQERVGVPGFRFGRRYEAVSGADRRFFAFYEVESPDVLSSKAYVDRLPPPSASRATASSAFTACCASTPSRVDWMTPSGTTGPIPGRIGARRQSAPCTNPG